MAQKCSLTHGSKDLENESSVYHDAASAAPLVVHENGALVCNSASQPAPSKSSRRRHGMEDPCFVAPHPDLLKEMIDKFNELKDRASQELPILRNLLRLKEPRSLGLNDGLLHPNQSSPKRATLTGAINVIVVLVDFSDKQFTASTQTAAHYHDLWFGVGNNSVNEFYKEASNNKVEISGEVVGPYRLPHPITYYANGYYGIGNYSPNSRNMATDAANLAKGNVDFSKYDNDGDGTVETFVIIHAGEGAERTGNVNDIWSHKWAMSSYVQDDGVTLFPYLTVPADCKLGVCAHELGHLAFDWPDLYDADYSSAGIGNWCLMAAGSYNGNESNPSPPSAWCKVDQEWVSVNTISKSSQVSLEDVKTGHSVLKIHETGAPTTEYWLLENRHKVGRDADLPGDGLLVWHVDDALDDNDNEAVHYKVGLLQADGRKDLENNEDRGDDGDPFPGVADVRAISSSTTPSTIAYSSSATTAFALANISDPAATMTFNITM
ncbi:hypothetical protein M758_4G267200 [Ceratodon purpureus]|nr:hypothetical protein M758_4G267200 [Ceratodon purpureus]KAG0621078.1 hypothetical protein M758_4G267200 [Ceratodon purpureus]KAG0621079.1 hypothetical protein M758_4G267200 [Ceratodon purpureus]